MSNWEGWKTPVTERTRYLGTFIEVSQEIISKELEELYESVFKVIELKRSYELEALRNIVVPWKSRAF